MKIPTIEIERNGKKIRVNAPRGEVAKIVPGLPDANFIDAGAALSPQAAPAQPDPTPAKVEPPATPTSPPAPATSAAAVVKRGRRWFVTDAQGVGLTAPGVNPKGYAKEAEAWAAILGGSDA